MRSSVSYQTFFEHESSRMLFEGALNTDIKKVFANSEDENDWTKQWENFAIEEREKAIYSESRGYKKSALEKYFRAANYYRLAQYHILEDVENKIKLYKSSLTFYDKVIQLSDQKKHKISFQFEDIVIKGILHLPESKNNNIPCVICIPGLGHNKESMHMWSQYALDRNMAVLCIDGPGYGESRILNKIKLNIDKFDMVISKAIDYLYNQSFVKISNIGILGDCFGGYLAFRAACQDKRIKACVLIEAILAFDKYQLKDKPMPPLVNYHVCESDIAKLKDIEKNYYKKETLENPLLIVHAVEDSLIPYNLAVNLYKSVKTEKELVTYDDKPCYDNYLVNHYNTVLDELFRCIPDSFDWINKILETEI